MLLRRKHQTTAVTTPRAKGADALWRRIPLWGTTASIAIAAIALANRPLAADPIQNAYRASTKLNWQTPKNAADPAPVKAVKAAKIDGSTGNHQAERDTTSEFDRNVVKTSHNAMRESAASETRDFNTSASTSSAGSVGSSMTVKVSGQNVNSAIGSTNFAKSGSGSTLRLRDEESATVAASEPTDTARAETIVDRIPAAQPIADRDRPTSQTSRLERAARPYSRKAVASKSAVQRLGDADASPFSSGAVDTDNSSLAIVQVAAVESVGPAIELPEAEVQAISARERELIEQAGLQEGEAAAQPSPFGNEQPGIAPNPFNQSPNGQLAQGPIGGRCPTPRDLKPLDQISTNIAAEPGPFPAECGLGDEQYSPRNWEASTMAWKASALCHKPLYFEDYDLERYGHTASPLLQPLVSAAQFWLVVPILPYKMGLEPPGECIYALGYYRPGSCAPRIIPNVPISLRGALLEAGVWVAGVALVP